MAKGRGNGELAVCHPERQHVGNGVCRPCYVRSWKAGNEKYQKGQRAYRHGLKVDVVATMEAAGCAICGAHDRLVIDHDHDCCAGVRSCGKCVRGVLCCNCNWGLGAFRDDPERLAGAITYIVRSRN